MEIEGFSDILNTLYIAKTLFDMDKFDLVKENFFDSLGYEAYYENMYSLIPNLFEYHHCRYYEERSLEIHVVSDPVIVDFYKLAGEYSKRNNIPDIDNPYFKEAERQVHGELDFSYCLDWRLMGHTEPIRPFHSRLALFISQDDWVDAGCLAYGLIEIYEWFSDSCDRLRKLLSGHKPAISQCEEAMAA
jgi:hypothetical protein